MRNRWGASRVLVLLGVLASAGMLMCKSESTEPGYPRPGPAPEGWTDCIEVLRINRWRGRVVANVERFGKGKPDLRTAYRISELPAADLEAFCDWEACLTTNGYAHACWIDDAGLERCRVCDAGDGCDGFPLDRAACVAQAARGRGSCHVGLLQECIIQRAIRGFTDVRRSETCRLSDRACAGELAGDLSSEALVAQHETDQVAIEQCIREVVYAAQLDPAPRNPDPQRYWRQRLSEWDGGLPADSLVDMSVLLDAGATDAPYDAETSDGP